MFFLRYKLHEMSGILVFIKKYRLLLLFLLMGNVHSVEPASLASPAQVNKAIKTFQSWIKFYQIGDYRQQYLLVHPRIRHYKNKDRWKKAMRSSLRKNGALINYQILGAAPITPDKIPCTEMGHCYRKDMQVVFILVNSNYQKIGVKEKEYVIMANSEDGWMFGGGTILNLPFGETMGILDRMDEKRYEFKRDKIVP